MTSPAPRKAFGGPGIEPRWTRSDKSAVGTAYFAGSRLWFTLAAGIVSEIYFPTLDRPQTRDLQFLITDGESFFHDERRDTTCSIEQISTHSLGFRMVNTNEEFDYRIVKEVITDPHYPCLLVRTKLEGDESLLKRLKLYALLAPHIEGAGWNNSGFIDEMAGRELVMAHRNGTWLAMGASTRLLKRSVGYVGTSDGWTDLNDNYRMDWEFDLAENGNIALIAELDLSKSFEFTLAVALGDSVHHAQTTLVQSIETPFAQHRERFIEQWQRTCGHVAPIDGGAGDGGCLYRKSHSLLLAHEDKSFPGALIASLSIPWGESKGDEDLGGYHLVWPRDLVHSSTALLATGNTATPYRSLVYLACTQELDGGFHQNFWINGDPYWSGIQLDEVSFAILLAWRVKKAGALRDFDPYPMVRRAAGYLVRQGPATPQERWEENSGYSPSSLAANIAALACAAMLAEERGDADTSDYLWKYADFLEANLDRWTVTTQSTLVPGISRHYIRILPVDIDNPQPLEDPNTARVILKNQAPGSQYEFPARDIVDAGFLELVRYGIRKAGDPLLEDSLAVVDRLLKVDTPCGPCWRRYNHDGYGQRDDGGPFVGWGRGRGWPLLTGERAHYELAAGRDVIPYIRTLENFGQGGLLAEQVWDAPDRPESRMWFGRPTGAAMPLVWAHAEYLTLLRSVADGQVFDFMPELAARYCGARKPTSLEIWKPNRRAATVRAGQTLRVQAPALFCLHWSADGWQTIHDTLAHTTPLGIWFVDLPTTKDQRAPLLFTFHWNEGNRWEGHDYRVEVVGGLVKAEGKGQKAKGRTGAFALATSHQPLTTILTAGADGILGGLCRVAAGDFPINWGRQVPGRDHSLKCFEAHFLNTLSVLFPVYNAHGKLAAAAAEVLEVLTHWHGPFTLWILDDGSTDDTAEEARALAAEYPQVRVIRHPVRLGLNEAVQTGLDRTHGELVLVSGAEYQLDPDDLRTLWRLRDAKPAKRRTAPRRGIDVRLAKLLAWKPHRGSGRSGFDVIPREAFEEFRLAQVIDLTHRVDAGSTNAATVIARRQGQPKFLKMTGQFTDE